MKPTQIEVAKLLAYCPQTGKLTHKISRPPRAVAGEEAGHVNQYGYRRISLHGEEYPAHHIAWLLMTGVWPISDVDHRNRKRDQNRWSNLREATRSQNLTNQGMKRNNRSGYKGVNSRGNSHVALFRFGGRTVRIGPFSTAEEAARTYDAEVVKFLGEFAVTNRQLGLIQ